MSTSVTDWNLENFAVQTTRETATIESLPTDAAAILGYWEKRRGDRFAPRWSEFEWSELPPRLVPWSLIVDVVPALNPTGLDFRYRFFGTAPVRMHGRDFTGGWVSAMEPVDIVPKLLAEYEFAVSARTPIHIVSEGRSRKSGEMVTFCYEFLRLPWSDDGVTVDRIFAVGFSDDREEGEFDPYRL